MTRLFIGGLNDSITRGDLEKEFTPFGHVDDCFVARNPPGFGFIVYEKTRDADKAIKEMDGVMVCGSRIRVEHARERGAGRGGGGGGGGGFRGSMSNIKCYNCGGFGHMSRDCSRSSQYGYSSRGGSRRSRSRSRSNERGEQRERRTSERRTRRSPSRSRSRSPRDRYARR